MINIPPKIITIGGRNSPFAVSLMILCVFAGLLGATGHQEAIPAYSTFDIRLWYVGLTFGGVISLAGMLWHDPITGMLIERVGQFMLASLMLSFGAGLFLLTGLHAFSSAIGDLTFGVACIARVVQIHVVARRIRQAVKIIEAAQ